MTRLPIPGQRSQPYRGRQAKPARLSVNNQMWVLGGGRTAPNPSNEVDIYDPGSNTWTTGIPFVTARRNFPADSGRSSRILLAGGYEWWMATMEIFSPGPRC